jgi:hypothetical protein
VYIPRGQFHSARTAPSPGGRALHVTLGIRRLTGHDVAELLAGIALADPVLREYAPPRAADPTGAGEAAWMAEIRARLAAHLGSAALDDAVAEASAALAQHERARRGG